MEEMVQSVCEGGIARKMVRSEVLPVDFSLSLVACGSCAPLECRKGKLCLGQVAIWYGAW